MPFKTFLRQKTQKCCFNLFRTQESASQAGLKFTQILFLSRNDNKQSPQFCLNEKRNQSNILHDQQKEEKQCSRFREIYCLFCDPLGPVVQRLISANPGLNFNPVFYISLFKKLFWNNFTHCFQSIQLLNCSKKEIN